MLVGGVTLWHKKNKWTNYFQLTPMTACGKDISHTRNVNFNISEPFNSYKCLVGKHKLIGICCIYLSCGLTLFGQKDMDRIHICLCTLHLKLFFLIV